MEFICVNYIISLIVKLSYIIIRNVFPVYFIFICINRKENANFITHSHGVCDKISWNLSFVLSLIFRFICFSLHNQFANRTFFVIYKFNIAISISRLVVTFNFMSNGLSMSKKSSNTPISVFIKTVIGVCYLSWFEIRVFCHFFCLHSKVVTH